MDSQHLLVEAHKLYNLKINHYAYITLLPLHIFKKQQVVPKLISCIDENWLSIAKVSANEVLDEFKWQ